MRRPWWLMFVLSGVVAAAGASVLEGDDMERNRRLLERWRADPEHYQRLQRDLRAYYALPEARQQQMRTLDRDLHEGDLAAQTRSWIVLERYTAWLDKLNDPDRARVLAEADVQARLRIIREIREREWVERLPARQREEVANLPPDRRAPRIARIRQEEQRYRRLWSREGRGKDEINVRPRRMSEMPTDVQDFIKVVLVPRLTGEEKERLSQADGKWPEYPRTVRELAEAHPVLPPLPAGAITRYDQLPVEAKQQLASLEKRKGKGKGKGMGFNRVKGQWPEFALEVTRILQREKLTPPPLGASRVEELPPEAQTFVRTKLLPELSSTQREGLVKLEGRWPEFPRQLIRLAQFRQMLIPGMSLPGPAAIWENARVALPNVPDWLLYQFAMNEASPEDRARWQLSTDDPMGSLEKIKKAYLQKHPRPDRPHKGKPPMLNGLR